jgi:FixJ family two-component response regulator
MSRLCPIKPLLRQLGDNAYRASPALISGKPRELVHFLGHPVPIVFITAYPEVSVRARALNSGAVCFLSKPYDGPTMARCIDAALSRRNAGSSDN